MPDTFTKRQRSRIMSRIKGKNTRPEAAVAKLLRKLKIRYRRHRRDLPGTPDFYLPDLDRVIMVHGCFWHGHKGCRRATMPATNRLFWETKIAKNRRRDRVVKLKLRAANIAHLTIWQCKLNDTEKLQKWLTKNLGA